MTLVVLFVILAILAAVFDNPRASLILLGLAVLFIVLDLFHVALR